MLQELKQLDREEGTQMPGELGTKDVLEQVDTRLGNVERDVRELRAEMNGRFDRVYDEIKGLRSEMNGRFDRVYQEMGGLRSEIQDRFRGVDQRFMWCNVNRSLII